MPLNLRRRIDDLSLFGDGTATHTTKTRRQDTGPAAERRHSSREILLLLSAAVLRSFDLDHGLGLNLNHEFD
ncbi:hypothetical protein CEP51_015981 [Fusarium floridanum]|uniref:Uncharacterized protein n=1 Tax=Fusarium floridanum TaxID=1325733 RepID=A0A428NZB4_9HYPO|nr:hypothetical protein CEP51_015981 [Fusarium floridanum]